MSMQTALLPEVERRLKDADSMVCLRLTTKNAQLAFQ